MSDTFWLNNPSVLLKSSQIIEIWPLKKLSLERKLNALTRLVIILTILGYCYTQKLTIIITSIITLLVVIIFYQIKKKKKKVKEGFNKANFFNLKGNRFTQPTKKNPVMNVLLTEINDNPKRPEAAPAYEPSVENEINTSVADPRLFQDLGDSIAFNQSIRNFYSMPSTTIPNDQEKFANYLYGNMPSCKEGNILQCTKNNAAMRPY